MSKTLIFAEKESVGTYIAEHLNATGQGNGNLITSQYVICWANGHLVGLAEPKEQNPDWGGMWEFAKLPMVPKPFRLEVIKKKARVFKPVQEAFARDDISRILVATDADREGELIFRYIYKYLGCTLPFDRLILTSNTPAAIKSAFNNIRPGSEFHGLAAASWARSNCDWLLGFNGTRAMTLAAGNVETISIGRVQTPTLAMCVQRKREIENFKMTPYWVLEGMFNASGQFFPAEMIEREGLQRAKFTTKEAALAARKRCDLMNAQAIEVERKATKEGPPKLFDMTLLQREANKRFGYTAKRTHDIAERLYDKLKAITYPRTDTNYLDSKVFASISQHIMAIHVHYMEVADAALANIDQAKPPKCVKDSEVTVHHAIIPSDTAINKDSLSEEQRNIYEMICKRFLAAMLPDAIEEKTRIVLQCGEERFKATGRVLKDPGWMIAEPKSGEDDIQPAVNKGDKVDVMDIRFLEKWTTPPSHLTEASLLLAMETAGKSLDDPDLVETLKGKGLGTSATRDETIETLIRRTYLVRDGKKIIATKKGTGLIESLEALSTKVKEVTPLLSPEMTAQWETALAEMSEARHGEHKQLYVSFQSSIVKTVTDICQNLRKAKLQVRSGTAISPCPICGDEVIDTPKSYRCRNWKPEEGCSFSIWKNTLGTKISSAMAAELITQGETKKKYKLKSQKGKEYSARLRYSAEDNRVMPILEQRDPKAKEPVGSCPCGKGNIYEREKSFGCSNWKEGGCKVTVWKSKDPQGASREAVKELLETGETAREYAFDKKKGGIFMARMVLIRDDCDGSWKVDYADIKSRAAAYNTRCANEPWWL